MQFRKTDGKYERRLSIIKDSMRYLNMYPIKFKQGYREYGKHIERMGKIIAEHFLFVYRQ